MKKELKLLIEKALASLDFIGDENKPLAENIRIEDTRDDKFGDYACNIAMVLAKQVKRNPRELAQEIISHLPASVLIAKAEVAGPGFINFFLTDKAFQHIVPEILEAGEKFGCNEAGKNKKIILEFVSANPTGPLHVGHGRGAAYGSSLANVLMASGYQVHREYYVNDSGRQMHILTLSIWLRYLELFGEKIQFPSNGYQGDYVMEIAQKLKKEHGDALCCDRKQLYIDLPEDNEDNKDFFVDQLIVRAKNLLAEKKYKIIFEAGLNTILTDIKQDLSEFGVEFDQWLYESSLKQDIRRGINQLTEKACTYEKKGALWFKAKKYGDEKDRVLIRADGRTTYFAADVGYHLNKYERGFDFIVDVFGADHHGYMARVAAFLKAINKDVKKFNILLVQFAILYRGKEKVQMSTRSGEFVTLRQLREEVGNDAARFFYVMRKAEQHLDFDLELAKSNTNENPVFYIQYAHARICSVLRQAQEKQFTWDKQQGTASLDQLTSQHEKQLLRVLARYPEVVMAAANHYEPHLIAHYLQQLAADFHAYYNAEQFLVDESKLRNARLNLIAAIQTALANGLKLLGVKAPESM